MSRRYIKHNIGKAFKEPQILLVLGCTFLLTTALFMTGTISSHNHDTYFIIGKQQLCFTSTVLLFLFWCMYCFMTFLVPSKNLGRVHVYCTVFVLSAYAIIGLMGKNKEVEISWFGFDAPPQWFYSFEDFEPTSTGIGDEMHYFDLAGNRSHREIAFASLNGCFLFGNFALFLNLLTGIGATLMRLVKRLVKWLGGGDKPRE